MKKSIRKKAKPVLAWGIYNDGEIDRGQFYLGQYAVYQSREGARNAMESQVNFLRSHDRMIARFTVRLVEIREVKK